MAKQIVFDDDARGPLLAGVSKLGTGCSQHSRSHGGATPSSTKAGDRRRSPKTAVTVAEDIELGRSEREPRRPVGEGSGQQDQRCGGRRHHHRH